MATSFKAWLHAPFIDLSPPVSAEYLTPFGVELAYRGFAERRDVPRFHSVLFPSFRERLKLESATPTVAIASPVETPIAKQTERWTRLCEGVEHAADLSQEDFDRLLWLLHKLCFHQVIVSLAKLPRGDEGSSEVFASITYTVALAHYVIQVERSGAYDATPFERLLESSPPGTMACVHATYQLAVHEAKGRKDLPVLERLLKRHLKEIRLASHTISVFQVNWLISRYYRVWAFLPQLRGDYQEMTWAMDEAEKIASSLPCPDQEHELCRRELMWPVAESRVKEAYALQDLHRANACAQRLVEMAPLQSRGHFQLGTTLLDLERFLEARRVFERAAELGPPTTEVALFYAAQCAEAEEDHEAAADAYNEVLPLDPLSVSARDCLARLPIRPRGTASRGCQSA